MRQKESGFSEWVRASLRQRALYEEAKNKDYTRHFRGAQDALWSDFKRQNYFLLRDERFQTKQNANFSREQIEELQAKLESISKSRPLANLIAAIGGQALQAPLSVLEFQCFKRENKNIALVGKFDLSLYFHFDNELRYINLNFSYGIKNPETNKNYILDQENRLIEVSDCECQCLSSALNALSNDVQTYLGFAINAIENLLPAASSAENVARHITRAFQFPEKIDLRTLLTQVELEIRPLVQEYLLKRRGKIIEMTGLDEEIASLDRLEKIRCKPIQGGGDYMAFFRDWSHLQVSFAEKDSESVKKEWLESHQINDILILRSSDQRKWQSYRIGKNKNLEIWEDLSDSLLESALLGLGPQEVGEYDYSVLRDLLGLNTRAVRQIDLVLANNPEALENHYLREENPIASILNERKPIQSKERESWIRRIFNALLIEELEFSPWVRDFVSMKKLRSALKFLLPLFQNESLLKGLSDGEFLQWVRSSLLIFFESLKRLSLTQDIRVQEFYRAQFFPKIEQARYRILAKRRKWLFKILKMDLNSEEIARFSRGLVREASKIFSFYRDGYSNLAEAFYAVYSNGWSEIMDNASDLDELIYRLAYMKMHDSINPYFIEILMYEAIHIKISREHNWVPRVADIFRKKSEIYFQESQKIIEEMHQKIRVEINEQNEEREKALGACDHIRQKALEFLKFKVSSEHYVAGLVMRKLADDLREVILEHYKSHVTHVNEDGPLSRSQATFISKLNRAIDFRIANEEVLRHFDGLGQKIKTHVLNFFLVVFTLGIFPLTRKFILKKPAFFSSVKDEIAEEARVILSHAG